VNSELLSNVPSDASNSGVSESDENNDKKNGDVQSGAADSGGDLLNASTSSNLGGFGI
jgi:hypothetical protein